MFVKLISKNERCPSNPENDKKPKDPIELPYVTAYDVTVATPETSLAKTYETKNEIKITLEIPKSDYKNESSQKLIKWAELPVQDENYYRDIAVNLAMAGDNERTVLFTHGRITLDIHNTTKADFVTVNVFVKQKEDQYIGVVFGQELGETYKEARKRVEKPPVPIIIATKLINENTGTAEYAKTNTAVSYDSEFYTGNKLDATFRVSSDKKTFTSMDGKRTYTLKSMLESGYRHQSSDEKIVTDVDGVITYKTDNYKRTIASILVNIDSETDSLADEGYLISDRSYAK